MRIPDENMEVRHYKRGIISAMNDGENAVGQEFIITLDKADMLDGYHTVFGELIEGDEVLKQVEESLTRLGSFKDEFKIEKTGAGHQ